MSGFEEAATPFLGFPLAVPPRQEAIMNSAVEAGLLGDKDARISGRVSARLIEAAKARTGIGSDSELLSFALASLAMEDTFLSVFDSVEGTVDPALDLEF